MRYLRRFESLDNISPDDIDDYLIDYIQLGFETDISVGSSYLLDFSKINKNKDYIASYEVDSFTKGISNSTLTISLRSDNKSTYKISDLEEAYDMLSSYLKDEFGLLPNYIMLNSSINRFSYFENFDHIKRFSENSVKTPNQINTHSIVFGFYKPVTPPYKIKKLVESSTTDKKALRNLSIKYGQKAVDRCEEIISDISDMLLELKDSGIECSVGWTSIQNSYPILYVLIYSEVDIHGGPFNNIDKPEKVLKSETIQRIKDYLDLNQGEGESIFYSEKEWVDTTPGTHRGMKVYKMYINYDIGK